MTDEERMAAVGRVAEQDYTAARADAAERVKIQWSIADATMKALLLANGGAMIALFTFVGNLMAKASAKPVLDPGYSRWAFGCFVVGLVLALFTHGLAFLSQEQFLYQSSEEAWRHQRITTTRVWEVPGEKELGFFGRANAFYALAFGLAVLSVVLFAVGCWYALQGVLIR